MVQQVKDLALSLQRLGLGHYCGTGSIPGPGTFAYSGCGPKNACGKLGIQYDSDTFYKLMRSLVKEIIGPWFIFWVDLRLPTLSICPKWGIHHN